MIQPRDNSPQSMLHVRKVHQQPNPIQLRPFNRNLHAIVVPMHVLALSLVSAQRVPRRKRLFHTYSKHNSPEPPSLSLFALGTSVPLNGAAISGGARRFHELRDLGQLLGPFIRRQRLKLPPRSKERTS